MTRSTLPPSSPIFLSLCACLALACAAASQNHCELDSCERSATAEPEGLAIPSNIEGNKEGQDALKQYLDSVFSNALFGSGGSDGGGLTETGQNRETHPENYGVEQQIKDEAERNTDAEHRLTIPSHIEKEGPDAIKEYLDNLFSQALFGTPSTQTEQKNQEARPDSHSVELDSKTQINHEGKRNINAHKSSYKLPKKLEEEQLLDGDTAINVDLEIVGDGEYVLKIKRVNVNPSSTNEDEIKGAKNMAQNGAMLLHYAEILQDMGEKLLAESQASLYSVFKMPAPSRLKSDQ